jgi:hypothetical protein
MREAQLRVLHVTALGDRQALETLSHAARVVDRLGADQSLIALDEGAGAHVASPPALAAETRTLGCVGFSIFGKVRALQMEFARQSEENLYAVHLHGISACCLGAQALAGSRLQSRVVYSPHLAAPRWSAPLLGRFWQSRLVATRHSAVTASPVEAQTLSKLLNRSTEVLPYPVAEVYFGAPRLEAARPQVLTDGLGREAADVVSRLSVLLNGREARVPIAWLGRPHPGVRTQLAASGVDALEVEHDVARARALSRASVFVHISSGAGLPIAVAQAMAAGVPCLVSDTPPHRALIDHGETGFVCTSERDLLEYAVLLLRNPQERRLVGEAARSEAARRFKWRHFERALLRAYGFSAGKPTAAGAARQALFPSNLERQACEPF